MASQITTSPFSHGMTTRILGYLDNPLDCAAVSREFHGAAKAAMESTQQVWPEIRRAMLEIRSDLKLPPDSAAVQEIREALSAHEEVLAQITSLDLSHKNLFAIPEEIGKCRGLRALNLSHNRIKAVSARVLNCLHNVEMLYLDHNEIEELPAQLFRQNQNLRRLWLSYNKIKRLPENAFHNLRKLKYLSLSGNEIRELHSKLFSSLDNLEKVHLGSNLIQRLPFDLLDPCQRLRLLEIDNNQIAKLPEELEKRENLKISQDHQHIQYHRRIYHSEQCRNFAKKVLVIACATWLSKDFTRLVLLAFITRKIYQFLQFFHTEPNP